MAHEAFGPVVTVTHRHIDQTGAHLKALSFQGFHEWGGRGSNPRRPDYEFADTPPKPLVSKGFCGIIDTVGHVRASSYRNCQTRKGT